MDKIIVKKFRYSDSDGDLMNSLFTILRSKSSIIDFGVSYIRNITKNLWEFRYTNSNEIRYYKFVGRSSNNANDVIALKKRLGSDVEIEFIDMDYRLRFIDLIKDIFVISDVVYFTSRGGHKIIDHTLKYTSDYIKVLSGKYPGYGLRLSKERPNPISIIDDSIASLQRSIKATEDALIARRRELSEMILKRDTLV